MQWRRILFFMSPDIEFKVHVSTNDYNFWIRVNEYLT